jgi:hypothetical protein
MNTHTIITFGIIVIFIPFIVFGQKQETIYLEKDNVVSNYYTVVYPDKLPYKGYMFLLPSTWETPEQLLFNTDLPMKAANKGILTIIPVFKTGINHLGADNLTQESFKEILNEVVSKHKLQKIKFFVGGFSIGGTCAVKYAQVANKNDFNIKPTLFLLLAAVDYLFSRAFCRFYYSSSTYK